MTRLYRAFLRLLPRELRDAYGEEMLALLALQLGDARERGRGAYLRAAIAGLPDLVHRSAHERWHRRPRPRSPSSTSEQPMSSLVADLRFALRSFVRQPGATA